METLELKTLWGSTEQVQLEISNYLKNGGMYIGIMAVSEHTEPYGDMTVNQDSKAPDYCGYVDTNNMPELAQFIEENKIGEFTGLTKRSGFCEYPLYLFDPEKLRELCPDGMEAYERGIGAKKESEMKEKVR